MVLAIQGIAPAPAETNILQNFDDATAGRSIQLYWGAASTDVTGTVYVLSRDAGISDPVKTEKSNGSVTLDFDITINKPTIFAGLGYLDANWTTQAEGATTSNIVFSIVRDRGGSETEIATVTTVTVNGTATDQNTKLKLTIPRTLFKIGNILRLRAVLTTTVTPVRVLRLRHDPQTAANELKLYMPIVNLE